MTEILETVKKLDEVKANASIIATLGIIIDLLLGMSYDRMDEDDAERLRKIFLEFKDVYVKYNNRYLQSIAPSEWMEKEEKE